LNLDFLPEILAMSPIFSLHRALGEKKVSAIEVVSSKLASQHGLTSVKFSRFSSRFGSTVWGQIALTPTSSAFDPVTNF
jgi:hypothetical protein